MSQPTEFEIRPARVTDMGDILSMIRELAVFEKLEGDLQVNETLLREAFFGPHPSASALFAHVGNVPAGYAIYFTTFSTFIGRPGIYLEDVYVRPDFRKRGIAQALMRRVAQAGVNRKCARYEWTALRWNENALRLYKKMGANTLDEWVWLRMKEDQMKDLAAGK